MEAPRVGDRHSFTPAYEYAWTDPNQGDRRSKRAKITVTGKIISVNYPHRHFTVGYEINGVQQRETFKF